MGKNIEVNGDQDFNMVKVYLLINLDIHDEAYGNLGNIRFDFIYFCSILFYYNHIF